MKLLILPNADKPGSIPCTRHAVQKLLQLGLTPMLDEQHAAIAGITKQEAGCTIARFEQLLPACDIILTIGGDGTILGAVQHALKAKKPLLGLNTGRIGFLTQLEANELDGLAILREGSYTILHRMLLDITLAQNGQQENFTALNEAVLSRGNSERLIEIAVTRDSKPVSSHRADGLIFATPTGSTAYNLAAGGPVSDPSLSLILMTAVCPHSQFHHTTILSPDLAYTAQEVPGNNKIGLALSVDGRKVGILQTGGHVIIRASQVRAPFIDLGLRDFYSCVQLKLRVSK